jgi:hypothetical protein
MQQLSTATHAINEISRNIQQAAISTNRGPQHPTLLGTAGRIVGPIRDAAQQGLEVPCNGDAA